MLHRLRLVSGLVLLTYVTTHLLNHSLGLVSLEAANAGRVWFVAFWRHPFGTILLYASWLTHFTLVMWALYQRRHLRIPRWEILRLTLGLLIPSLLLQHIFGTRAQHEMGGVEDDYTRQVLFFWVLNPSLGVQQLALLSIAWLHGCLGLYYWLRVKGWRRWTLPGLRLVGPLLPILAVLGFADMGQEISALAADPLWVAQIPTAAPPEVAATIDRLKNGAYGLYVGSVLAVFGARRDRTILQRRKGVVCLAYPNGQQVLITPGTTVLEGSRAAGIPHASLCGGRGRCSTCRARIGAGAARVPEPSADEARVLRRLGARALTAIGDAVNTASRLESLTKEYASQVVVSDEVASQAGVDLSSFPRYEIEIRGRVRPLGIRVIPNAHELEPVLAVSSRGPIGPG